MNQKNKELSYKYTIKEYKYNFIGTNLNSK